jgi:GxxExxY protein
MDWKVDWELSERIIGAAIETHRELGPGLLESVYEECLCWHLRKQNLAYKRQQLIPLTIHDVVVAGAFRLDLVVEQKLIVELKSVEALQSVHKSQVITYLKLTGLKTGLLINFNTSPLKHGIKRVVNP